MPCDSKGKKARPVRRVRSTSKSKPATGPKSKKGKK